MSSPKGAPNVVLVVTDDMGFSDIGPFGAEVDTPTLNALAGRGVRLTNYHTAPVCSPARAAMLTGLNPHRAGYGAVSNFDPGFPGYTMEFTENVPTLGESLRMAGYATMAVGKWHLARIGAHNPAASRASWPLQRGFDRYYGELEGLTNLFHPHQLVIDNSPIDLDEYPDDYYLTNDYTDHAIRMIKELRAHESDQPFFLYLAHNAVHAPLHAPAADIAKYLGRYDEGWDALRDERFRRQLAMGMFPEGTRLPQRNAEAGLEVQPWHDTKPEQRERLARYMSAYAGMVDNIDQNLGRLLATIDQYGELDDTLVIFCADNGASSEGGRVGTRSYFSSFTGRFPLPSSWQRDVERPVDVIGGPQSLVHYPRGWAMASNTPFRLYKGQTYAGGVRVPCVISWPGGGIGGSGGSVEQRGQYLYVTDLMPTILDLVGVERPDSRHGEKAPSLDGVSAARVLRSADAEEVHRSQYIEFFGNRSMYADGWKLVSLSPPPAPANSDWRLYDIRSDPTEVEDVGSRFPEVVEELKALWEKEAWSNGVYPQDDGSLAMMLRHRPDEDRWSSPLRLLPGTPPLERHRSSRLIAAREFEISAKIHRREGDEGVLVAHGDQGGGYVLYIENAQIHFGYNEYGLVSSCCAPAGPPGPLTVRIRASVVDDVKWTFLITTDSGAEANLGPVMMLIGQAPFQGIAVGRSPRSPVLWDLYERHRSFPYTGNIDWIDYNPGAPAPYFAERLLKLQQEIDAAYE